MVLGEEIHWITELIIHSWGHLVILEKVLFRTPYLFIGGGEWSRDSLGRLIMINVFILNPNKGTNDMRNQNYLKLIFIIFSQ